MRYFKFTSDKSGLFEDPESHKIHRFSVCGDKDNVFLLIEDGNDRTPYFLIDGHLCNSDYLYDWITNNGLSVYLANEDGYSPVCKSLWHLRKLMEYVDKCLVKKYDGACIKFPSTRYLESSKSLIIPIPW